MSFAPGALVTARGREWVVLPESAEDFLILRPLGGADEEIAGVHTALEAVAAAALAPPSPADLGDFRSARLLRDAVRLGFRASAGPFRSFGRIAFEPRPYQLVPLLLALKLEPIRLLIADDVGVGKTIEACMIAREMLDRGEIGRIAVLCPPHLAEQWQRELAEKFALDAELVLPSTARRLEAGCGVDQSLFDVHPFVVVSTDYIKSDRRRADFLRACPELVIVDEAHTCADPGAARSSAHQRHELVRGLSANPDRHLILVTATPHSGNEGSFRSLLGLLDPEFTGFPADLSGPENEPYRVKLAAHFVQRRRADVEQYLDAATPFPARQEREESYTLHPDYRRLFEGAIAYARELVRDENGGALRQRIRLWSALAMLRSLASSPAAAAATLRNRAAVLAAETVEAADEIGGRTVLDAAEDEPEPVDVAPGSETTGDEENGDPRERRALLAMAAEAEGLFREKDEKLKKAAAMIRSLLRDGYHPIVFCRFIPTAEYLAQALRERLPKATVVEAVTGLLAPEDREARVAGLAAAPSRVLVCTDCLSEGINLQDAFDAVLHYDLAWNPTRHEQREGRADRYGQLSPTVRVITYYGTDNQIDGVVLDVLLRKHQSIRKSLGISVPVPGDSEKVMTALLQGALLRGQGAQLPLAFDPAKPEDGGGYAALDTEWQAAADREKLSRSLFAQRAINPQEVAAELAAARRAVGSPADAERLVRESLAAYGAVIVAPRNPGAAYKFDLRDTPSAVLDAMGVPRGDAKAGSLAVCFAPPCPEGAVLLTRTHPFVSGLAGYVIDSAVDPRLSTAPLARRAGVVRTKAVESRTTLLLIRERFQLRIRSGRNGAAGELLAEDWQLLAFRGSPASPEWLSDGEAEALLSAQPEANIAADIARAHLGRLLNELPALSPHLDAAARRRADDLLAAHRRVRRAARLSVGQISVEPKLPADFLGVYLYLPVA
ncbi:MAG: DEAD/DEAH box helicase [Terriglobales bacterium]